jgi:hypothetical protein
VDPDNPEGHAFPLEEQMTEVALIVLALANLYLLVRFIKWARRDLPERLDQATAMKLSADSRPDLPKAAEKVSQGEISFETLREAIRRDREQR